MISVLALPAFFAGLLTFLAPCTLPLVPGYLSFISGVSLSDLKNPTESRRTRRRIFLNGLFYVIGFSLVFVLMGSLVGLLGSTVLVKYRVVGSKVGGAFVILFGVIMVKSALVFYEDKWPWLQKLKLPFSSWLTTERKVHVGSVIKPGNPISSVVFGAAFAIGWTPCVGSVLGAILTLAATGVSVGQGALLLLVFLAGLGVPFLILAAGVGYFADRLQRWSKILPIVSIVGGFFIVVLGVLVLMNRLGLWISLFFQWFSFINYESLLNYL